MLRVEYVNEIETRTSTLRRQRVESVAMAVRVREENPNSITYPPGAEPGYPISGDMLAVLARENEAWFKRRRARFARLAFRWVPLPKGWKEHV